MKTLKHLFLALIAMSGIMTFAACSDDDNTNGGNSTDIVDPTIGYQIVSVDSISSDEMAEKIYKNTLEQLKANADDDGSNSEDDFEAQAQEAKNAYLKRTQEVCDSLEQAMGANGFAMGAYRVKYNYQSIDAEGKPITLSAFVSIPAYWWWGWKPLDPNYVLLHCHECALENSKCPTENDGPSGSSTPDAVIIAPDFIGYGLTKSQSHPVNNDLNARNALDAFKVGYDIAINVYNAKMEEDWHTYIVGMHEGAAIALATQKLMEQDSVYCENMKLKLSFIYQGDYDLAHTVDSLINSGEIDYNYAYYFPYLIEGLMAGYPEIRKYYTLDKFFSDAFIGYKAFELLRSKESSKDDINKTFGSSTLVSIDLKRVLHEDLFDKNSEKYKLLHQCLEKNIVYKDWTPTHYIHFYYTKGSDIEPVENISSFIAHLKAQGLKYDEDYETEEGGETSFWWNLICSSY